MVTRILGWLAPGAAPLAMALVLCAWSAHAQERAETLFNLVNLSAQAEREVSNDLLTAMLAAEAEGADPAALADTVNRSMREALKLAQNYKNVKARSLNYQTWPVYDKAKIIRWRVRQELRLESQDFSQATDLIGKLQAGPQPGLLVASMSVGLSTEARKQAENALIGEALAAFHERCAIVRVAQKASSYRVKELQIGTSGAQPRPYAVSRMAAASPAPPAVEPGASVIQVSVSGTVQLQ